LFREVRDGIRIIHQSGPREHDLLRDEFRKSELEGEVVPFIPDMPQAFAQADLVIARAGAGSVNEIAAGGMASVLVPLPFAADDHQRRNAEALVQAGAASMVLDAELDGNRLFEEVERLRHAPATLERMRAEARKFAKPDAASRAADILEKAARGGSKPSECNNNQNVR
jgi:UDP-N-acetylglucosamine--N-acetylmuramyl-(pentapeptide) pyrophosphoryl-undecaprenol N-acetylglucosamine transferase